MNTYRITTGLLSGLTVICNELQINSLVEQLGANPPSFEQVFELPPVEKEPNKVLSYLKSTPALTLQGAKEVGSRFRRAGSAIFKGA